MCGRRGALPAGHDSTFLLLPMNMHEDGTGSKNKLIYQSSQTTITLVKSNFVLMTTIMLCPALQALIIKVVNNASL